MNVQITWAVTSLRLLGMHLTDENVGQCDGGNEPPVHAPGPG